MQSPVAIFIRKLISTFFVFALILSLSPATAFAQQEKAISAKNASAKTPLSGDVINEEVKLDAIARAESTRNYLLANAMEGTHAVPVVNAKLSIGDEPSDDSVVVGSFERDGMTYAIEPGGGSVALVAVDYGKLSEEAIQKQVLIIPDTVSPDGIEAYSVTRIADGAFSSLTKGSADVSSVGCEALLADEELLAEAGIDADELARALYPEQDMIDIDGDGELDTVADPLKGCTGILAIGIPASVSSIEDGAFSGSDTLQYLVVSDDNPDYASYDGALYSADLATLRLIPEGRVGAVRVAPNATDVDPEVFSHCPSVDIVVADPDGAAFGVLEKGNADSGFERKVVSAGFSRAPSGSPLLIWKGMHCVIDEMIDLSDVAYTGMNHLGSNDTVSAVSLAGALDEINNVEDFLSIFTNPQIYVFRDNEAHPIMYQRCVGDGGRYDIDYTENPSTIFNWPAASSYPIRFQNARIETNSATNKYFDNFGVTALSAEYTGGITELALWDPHNRRYVELLPGATIKIAAQWNDTVYVFINGFRLPYLVTKHVLFDVGSYGGTFQEGLSLGDGDMLDGTGAIVDRWVPLDEASTPDVLENVTSIPDYEVVAPTGFTFKGWAAQRKDNAGALMFDDLGNRMFETEYARYDPATNTTFTQTCVNGEYLTEETGRDLVIEKDTTFYAVFVADITFDGGTYGGRVQSLDENGKPMDGRYAASTVLHEVPHGDKVSLPAVEEKGAGWTFQGWATKDETGTLSERDPSLSQASPVKGHTTFYAAWGVDVIWQIDEEAKGEGILIEGEGTDVLVDGNVLYGTPPSKGIPAPTSRRGYVFKGWRSSYDNGLHGGRDGTSTMPALKAPTTFTAEWEAIDYEIAFDVDGGYVDGYVDWSPDSFKAKANLGGSVMLPSGMTNYPVPARYGYAFSGWYAMREGERVYFCDAQGTPEDVPWAVDGDGTLFAAWVPKEYKISWMFNYEQGSAPEGSYETVQTFDAPLKLPSDVPSRPGFTSFDGWFQDRSAKIPVAGGGAFAPAGLEDRYGKPEGGNTTFYYASFSGAEEYWVKLESGEGGRFGSSDGSYDPDDFHYAFSPDGMTPAHIIVAGDPKTIELHPAEQGLSSRISDYVFAGWAEVEGSWDEEHGFRSVKETVPGSVYEKDTMLPDGSVRLANTLRDDTIPEEVLGNRTLVALWRSEKVPLTLKLGETTLGNVATPVFDEDALKDMGFEISSDETSATLSWGSPYVPLDLSDVASCDGYRLVGFAKEDDAGGPFLSMKADPLHPASSFAGTYVAYWEAEDRTIVFHDNHHHDGTSSERDVRMEILYDEDVVLPYPSTSFPQNGTTEDGLPTYGSYAFKWWGTRPLETSSAHAGWKADSSIPFHEMVSQVTPDGDGTYHLYAQWVSSVSVTIPLYVNVSIDPDRAWADILVGEGDGVSFVGLESASHALFKVRSIECESVNVFTDPSGKISPLVTDPGEASLSEGGLFLTIASERADSDGTSLPFDVAHSQSAYVDGITTLDDGSLFDAKRCGLAVSSADPTGPTRIPLRFGLSFGKRADGSTKDVTDFRFADLVSDDPTSKGALARVRYTIEAL